APEGAFGFGDPAAGPALQGCCSRSAPGPPWSSARLGLTSACDAERPAEGTAGRFAFGYGGQALPEYPLGGISEFSKARISLELTLQVALQFIGCSHEQFP